MELIFSMGFGTGYDVCTPETSLPYGAKDGENNFYILGFDASGSERDEYFFVDSIPIRAGDKMPDVVRERIESGYKETVFTKSARGWEILFGEERRLTQ